MVLLALRKLTTLSTKRYIPLRPLMMESGIVQHVQVRSGAPHVGELVIEESVGVQVRDVLVSVDLENVNTSQLGADTNELSEV